VSGETEQNVSGWTTDTLHTHLSQMIVELRRDLDNLGEAERRAIDLAFATHATATQAAFVAQKEAIRSALAATEKAIDVQAATLKQQAATQNEWRGSLNDVSTRAMPRSEAEAAINRATERIQEMITVQQHMVTREELAASHDRSNDRLTEIATRLTRVEALAQGAQSNKDQIASTLRNSIAALGLLLTIVVIVVNVVTGSPG
jgi:hypothetical protein